MSNYIPKNCATCKYGLRVSGEWSPEFICDSPERKLIEFKNGPEKDIWYKDLNFEKCWEAKDEN